MFVSGIESTNFSGHSALFVCKLFVCELKSISFMIIDVGKGDFGRTQLSVQYQWNGTWF